MVLPYRTVAAVFNQDHNVVTALIQIQNVLFYLSCLIFERIISLTTK